MINLTRIKNLFIFNGQLFNLLCCLFFCLQFNNLAAQTSFSSNMSVEQLHQQAIKAMSEGNYAIAFCIWSPLASSNHAEAQYNIGWMYHNGYGLRINDERAFYWWLKSASNGFTDAEFALGDLFYLGQGVEKNTAIALGFYIAAAINGHENARETLREILTLDQGPRKSTSLKKLKPMLVQTLLDEDYRLLGSPLKIAVKKANIRSGPGLNYSIVKTLNEDETVVLLRKENDWLQIGLPDTGQIAWVYQSLAVSREPESDSEIFSPPN